MEQEQYLKLFAFAQYLLTKLPDGVLHHMANTYLAEEQEAERYDDGHNYHPAHGFFDMLDSEIDDRRWATHPVESGEMTLEEYQASDDYSVAPF